jgi:hypothetical protein
MNDLGVHLFTESLALSKSKEGALDRIYWNYFQNVTGVSRIDRTDDMELQRAGIDTFVTLESGEIIRTQEKWRFRPYTNDILIEYCSVWRDGECISPGWIYTCDADYIFMVYQPSDLVKIYPVVQLKIAWNVNRNRWIRDHFNINARNLDYVTKSVAVPTDILEDEIRKTMRFDYQRKLSEVAA